MQSTIVRRRSLLRLGVAGMASAAAAGTMSASEPDTPTQPATSGAPQTPTASGARPRVLLAFFSRAGWNYHNGGRTYLQTGNTEVLAGIISRLISCAVHRIRALDPYSDDYDDTVARNVREQNANARPAIANPLASIDQYDTVLLASGIWNVRAPMIMSTFADSYDFTGITVYPVTTYAMSGLGTAERDYAASCRGATLGAGLAVRGEDVGDAQSTVEAWLREHQLLAQHP